MSVKVGILSDTHGHIDAGILGHLADCDEIWHAGDIDSPLVLEALEGTGKVVRAVHGNVDGPDIRVLAPPYQQFDCEGLRVFITHIAGYGNHLPADLMAHYEENPFDVLVCGHTHVLKVQRIKPGKVLYINPGACGLFGPHTMRTMLVGTVSHGRFTDLSVIELGPRVSDAH